MTKQEICQQIYNVYNELSEAIKCDDIKLIKELALKLHSMVHPAEISDKKDETIADHVFKFMKNGNRDMLVPRENYETDLHYAGAKDVPLCWYFWHTYRIEDIVSNILISNGKQIFNADWQSRIGASIIDTGNALTVNEATEFIKNINTEELYKYMLAVGRNTRKIIQDLTLEQINSMVPEERVMRILEEGGVTTDFRSVWLLVFWGRLTIGGMILTPLTSHHMMHLPAVFERI